VDAVGLGDQPSSAGPGFVLQYGPEPNPHVAGPPSSGR
jgi:hypothetical protein